MPNYIYKGMLYWRDIAREQEVVLHGAIYRIYDKARVEYYETYWLSSEKQTAIDFLEKRIRNNSEKEGLDENL